MRHETPADRFFSTPLQWPESTFFATSATAAATASRGEFVSVQVSALSQVSLRFVVVDCVSINPCLLRTSNEKAQERGIKR
jgi:hypothetical protein